MPVYASVSDLQSEFKGVTFSATSTVPDTKVSDVLEEIDELIDGYIGSKYVTPVVSAPKALKLLRMISLAIAKPRIASILKIKGGSTQSEQASSVMLTSKQAMDKLKDIQKGDLNLLDAELLSTEDGVEDFLSDASEFEPTFKRGIDQW